MKRLKFLWWAFAGLLLVSCGGISRERATSAAVLREVNLVRSKRGLSTLVEDPSLAKIARGHAANLVKTVNPTTGKPSSEAAHRGFWERAARAEKIGYGVFSEVVMIGYAGDLDAVARRTIKGWLESPSHRRAILHPNRHFMGVATRLPADQRYFVVGLLSDGRTRKE